MVEECQQYTFYSLQRYNMSLPRNPTSANLKQAQSQLFRSIIEYKSKFSHGPTQSWANYTV